MIWDHIGNDGSPYSRRNVKRQLGHICEACKEYLGMYAWHTGLELSGASKNRRFEVQAVRWCEDARLLMIEILHGLLYQKRRNSGRIIHAYMYKVMEDFIINRIAAFDPEFAKISYGPPSASLKGSAVWAPVCRRFAMMF